MEPVADKCYGLQYSGVMAQDENSLRNSNKHWILDPAIPDIEFAKADFVRQVNMAFSIPFGYTGIALLSPEGQVYAKALLENAGRCLGGGVLASRDLEWIASGKIGEKPGDFVPRRGIFTVSKEPQSVLPSEWIAFEYGLLLRAPFGSALVCAWDDVLSIAKVRTQGHDTHIRLDGGFGGKNVTIFAQANKHGIDALLKISELAGVLVYN
jgi:hypothetical protein